MVFQLKNSGCSWYSTIKMNGSMSGCHSYDNIRAFGKGGGEREDMSADSSVFLMG